MLAMQPHAPGVYLIGGVRYSRAQALRLVDELRAMLAADGGSQAIAMPAAGIVARGADLAGEGR